MAGLLIAVDRAKCTGEGVCVVIAPYVFEISDEGIAEVVNCDGADMETILEAAQSCPTGAISVVEASVGRRFQLREGTWQPRARRG